MGGVAANPWEVMMTNSLSFHLELERTARSFGRRGLAAAAVVAVLCGGCSSSPSQLHISGGDGGGADTAPSRASQVVMDGYLMVGPWSGGGFTATDPGAATITPSCTADSCTPAFTGNEFCMQGTVTGRADYTGFAMLGWNVAQPAGGTAGTWAVPDSGGITVTVLNIPSAVALRVQLQGTDPHSSADRWCANLTNGKSIAWSDFQTTCWAGGSPLAPGTPIQQGSIIVPGTLTDFPFDVCLLNIQIQ
jgi:hypothetical protein